MRSLTRNIAMSTPAGILSNRRVMIVDRRILDLDQILECLVLAEGVEKVGAGGNFWCPLIEGADISLPPRYLPRRFALLDWLVDALRHGSCDHGLRRRYRLRS